MYRHADGPDYIVFRDAGQGEAAELHANGGTYERIGLLEQTTFHSALLLTCVAAFLTYAGLWMAPLLWRRRSPSDGAIARHVAAFVAVTNLIFLAALVPSLRNLGAVTPLPWPMVFLLSLPLVSLAATALLPAFAARAWTARWWTRRWRVGYSTFALLSIVFLVFLNYWKLLGVRY